MFPLRTLRSETGESSGDVNYEKFNSAFYRIYFEESAQELFDLVPPSPFYHRTSRHRKDLHPYVVDIPWMRTKRFASSFLIRTARIWNALPASIFPSRYNMSTFKSRVNRHLLGKRAPP
ncbi:jg5842 [Pararge aegeria aegeria]|uniref:Jg5842 protein n=1 Tax=Pararge aegeria aegeria TaxID=348720 RepID=A0A8S4SGN6_9NEOP|nr:jg5842 [Pararge aegeria aegeria]